MITEALGSAKDEDIRNALQYSDPMVLLGLLYHATTDETLKNVVLAEVWAMFGHNMKTVTDPAWLALLRDKAFDLIVEYRDGGRMPPTNPSIEQLRQAVSLAAGEDVPREELDLHLDMLALEPNPRGWGDGPTAKALDDFRVIVIGGGMQGVNAAIQLHASRIPFLVLERNAGVGGTWFQNTFPGARVDFPSALYTHSYGVDYIWDHAFAPQAHNQKYFDWCVDRFGIRSHFRFKTEVTAMEWDHQAGMWQIHARLSDGTMQIYQANAVISAIGLLDRPNIPKFSGMDKFRGPMFHTARFDHSIDFSDKHVAVIGTGATGLQLVPDLAQMAKHVTVLQRTASWVFPLPGYRDPLPDGAVWLSKNLPFYRNWTRFVYAWNLGDKGFYEQHIIDPTWQRPDSVSEGNYRIRCKVMSHMEGKLAGRPDLLAMCTPQYPVFGTRPVIDNGWFDALTRDNVTLVTAGVERFTEDGLTASNGEEISADVIILATGFRPNEYFSPIKISGRDNMSMDEIWSKDGPRAYWGIAVPSFPNLFILYGPNNNPRNLGTAPYGEWAVNYFLRCFKTMIENGWKSMEVRKDVYDTFNEALDERLKPLVSVNPRTSHKSYYTNDQGRSAVQSPWSSAEVRRTLVNVNFDDYHIELTAPTRNARPRVPAM